MRTDRSSPDPVLFSLAATSPQELHGHLAVLEHFGLAELVEDWDGTMLWVAGNSTPGIGWPVMKDLKKMAAGNSAVIRQVLVDLDFTALDQ